MAGVSSSLENIALQKSGRYVDWVELTSSAATMPLTGSTLTAIDVSGIQLAKIAISSSGACTLGFNIQFKYEGDDTFYRVDQSERTSVNYHWVQQADVSAVQYIYVCVSSYTGTGTYKVSIGKCGDAP
jgi:hypothetical protein